jgi:predicted Rossmann fold nucleotide-binding protein DprA/Smf involved in DNA uptake
LLALDERTCLSAGVRPEWLQARDPYCRGADSQWEDRAVAHAHTLDSIGGSLFCLGSDDYPALPAEIPDPPPLLYTVGDMSLLALPQIAMVGSGHWA